MLKFIWLQKSLQPKSIMNFITYFTTRRIFFYIGNLFSVKDFGIFFQFSKVNKLIKLSSYVIFQLEKLYDLETTCESVFIAFIFNLGIELFDYWLLMKVFYWLYFCLLTFNCIIHSRVLKYIVIMTSAGTHFSRMKTKFWVKSFSNILYFLIFNQQ